MSTLTSTVLTSKGAILVYSLPLLLISLTLAFAGAYLSLDRTRSFPALGNSGDSVVLDVPGTFLERDRVRQPDSEFDWAKSPFNLGVPKANPRFVQMIRSSKHRANLWRLEGGLGGLLAGYLFGACVPTVLTLYVMEHTSRTMTRIPFLIITFLAAVVCSVLSGKFHKIMLLIGCVGGSFAISTFGAFAFSLSTIGRLSLWAALATLLSIVPVVYIFTPSGKVYTALHWSMRIANSAFGSMGVVYSIAILAHVPGWENALSAIWSITRHDNGSTLALSIMGWLFFVLGVGCDWILYRTLGPTQDQRWDNYLSHYLDNLPNRAGRFERLPSFWSRFFSIFHRSHEPLEDSLDDSDEEILPSSFGKIPKNSKKWAPRKAAPAVRFDLAASAADSDIGPELLPSHKAMKEGGCGSSDNASDQTLLGGGESSHEIDDVMEDGGRTTEKLETESDITSNPLPTDGRLADWKPAFLLKSHEKPAKFDD